MDGETEGDILVYFGFHMYIDIHINNGLFTQISIITYVTAIFSISGWAKL